MASAGIIGAAVGCGLALFFISGFIIFRHKNRKKCVAEEKESSPLHASSWIYSENDFMDASKVSRNAVTPSFVQPDGPTAKSVLTNHGFSRSQSLFPIECQRKLSSSIGYSFHSNDACLENTSLAIKLHYRIYYDLDNSQLILHVLEAHFKNVSASCDAESRMPNENFTAMFRDTYVAFYLSGLDSERCCGQTKIVHLSELGNAHYDEIFALPVNYESLMDQRLHFEVLHYTNHSRPQPLGCTDVALETHHLNNQDLRTELNVGCVSSMTDFALRPRPEVLIFSHLLHPLHPVLFSQTTNTTNDFPPRGVESGKKIRWENV